MELCWCGKHCIFNFVPKRNSSPSESFDSFIHFSREVLRLELIFNNWTVNPLDRKWQDHIENQMLSLETIGYIISATTGMLHRPNIYEIFDVLEVTSLGSVKHVEPTLFDQLSDHF